MPIDYSLFRGTAIPEEPESKWESPDVVAGWSYLFTLMGNLPEYQRVICAISACEMVLPQGNASLDRLEGEIELANQFVEAAYNYLEEGPLTNKTDDYTLLPDLSDLEQFIDAYPQDYPHLQDSDYFFIRGFYALGMMTQYGDEDPELSFPHTWAGECVRSIIAAVGHLATEQPDPDPRLRRSTIQHEAMMEFSRHWWARCRARLAWRTAPVDVLADLQPL